MYSRCQEQQTANPSMKPVDALMGDASKKHDRSSFGGQKIGERDLRDGDPCRSKGDIIDVVLG